MGGGSEKKLQCTAEPSCGTSFGHTAAARPLARLEKRQSAWWRAATGHRCGCSEKSACTFERWLARLDFWANFLAHRACLHMNIAVYMHGGRTTSEYE